MKILVTGGLGFQGIHIVAALLQRGHDVSVLNTPSERARTVMIPALLAMVDQRSLVNVILGSVTDADTLEKVMPYQDAVIHMAAWASVDQSLDRPWPPWEVNATGTLAVLESIRRFGSPHCKLVVASSCEVYGPAERQMFVSTPEMKLAHTRSAGKLPSVVFTDPPKGDFIPQDERWPMLPRSPYAASKIAGDRMAYAYAVTYNMDITILRPSNIYGPWQRHGSFGAVIPTFVKRALAGESLLITGGGQQSREFLNVTDLADAYVLAIESPVTRRGEVYNVGSGETIAIRDLAIAVAGAIAHSGKIEYSDARVADVSGFLLDSAKFKTTFQWAPTVKFVNGLQFYIDWAKEGGVR